MLKKKIIYILTLVLAYTTNSFSQNKVAITIDDIPNTEKYYKDGFKSLLINKLDSLKIPTAIFINEGLIFKTDSVIQNFKLLNDWIQRSYTELGNHTYDHPHCSDIDNSVFIQSIDKGEYITRNLAKKYGKPLSYFRFPFNDLGKDSIHQKEIAAELRKKGYVITPFTIESSDWMYNYLYTHYLKKGLNEQAKQIAEDYINTTLAYFDFFAKLANKQYNRPINHIYLCHDNAINADYLDVLLQKLKEKDYNFISLTEALKDPVYKQENVYYKKWGVSWIYRWMKDSKERVLLMKQEPDMKKTYELYQKATEKK